MRILYIDGASAETLKIRGALLGQGHHVELVEPADRPRIASLLDQPWDVVLLEWLTATATLELLARAAAAGDAGPACIVTTAKLVPANVEAAFRAGAEDFLRKPLVVEHLLGRLGRIGAQRERLAAAASRVDAETPTVTAPITDLAAWSGFESLAAEAVSGVTTLDVAVTEAPASTEPWLAATMVLSFTSAQLECRAVVDGDRASLERMADAAIGDHGEAAIADLLNEIVNTAGGAFMRSAQEEAVLVTSGLPSAISSSEVDQWLDSAHHTVVCWLQDPRSRARLRVRLGVRSRRNAYVRVGALREGMVLARDLRSAEGAVLLTAGTRVTLSSSERLRRLLDAGRMIEVADTAA